jgi:hypothetical protein
MPRYYLDNPGDTGKAVTVRDSATGHILATVRAPAGHVFSWLAAAADDRTFVLTGISGPQTNPLWGFYLLRLAPDGIPVSMSRLAYTLPSGAPDSYVSSIAVSPDASLLAVARVPGMSKANGKADGPARITEVSVATGTVLRSWTAPGTVQFNQLSWVRGGGISYTSYDYRPLPHHPPITQLRLLDTSRPGADLLADSRVLRIGMTAGSTLTVAGVTPDGSKILAWAYPLIHDPSAPSDHPAALTENSLGEYSARTGQLLRVLYGKPLNRTQITAVTQFSLDPSGQHVLFQATNTYGAIIFGRIDNGRFTSLPHPAHVTTSSTGQVLSAW